jgi:oxygen-dependent protoporphyrinogen oxidase
VEGGPDSILTHKPWALELCHALGLSEQLIPTQFPATVYVLRGDRLIPLPEGMQMVAPTRVAPFLRSPLLSWRGKLRAGLDLLLPPRKDDGDESLAAFVRRRLGDEVMRYLAEPLLAGIYAARGQDLSLLATFPRLRELELRYGSLIRGLRADGVSRPAVRQDSGPRASLFVSLREGMEGLVRALVDSLAGVELRTAAEVTSIQPGGGVYRVTQAGSQDVFARAVVVATPAHASARVLKAAFPALTAGLDGFSYASSAVVSLGFRRQEVTHPLNGHGCVVVRRPREPLAACTWSSSKFEGRAPPGHVLLRAVISPYGQPELLEAEAERLTDTVCARLAPVLGLTGRPQMIDVRHLRAAHPQYNLGHLERVDCVIQRCPPGLFLAGSAFRGVGIPDCVRAGQSAAQEVMAYLAEQI